METSDSPPPPPPPLSFSSLPNDIVLNCLARVSRIYYPTLALVSKSFRSIISSRELYATRTLIGKTEDILYVCLNLSKYKPETRWFALSQTPKQQKLIPMPSFPYTENSTVLSTGSEIYMIGGFSNEESSRRVLLLDYQCHQWRRLPDMRVARRHPAADVIDDKIYVIGGHTGVDDRWGEFYNPKTQTWNPLAKTTQRLTIEKIEKSVLPDPDEMVIGGQIYSKSGEEIYSPPSNYCLVELENVLYEIYIGYYEGKLAWRDLNKNFGRSVLGIKELPNNDFAAVVKSSGGRKVIVWWKTVMYRDRSGKERKINTMINRDRRGKERKIDQRYHNAKECKTYIWCAEISLERREEYELRGFVEWSKCVIYYDGYETNSDFFLDSATTM